MLTSHSEMEIVPGVKTNFRDIEVYLRALESYVDAASAHPNLSFEEHYRVIAAKPQLQLASRALRASAR